MILKGGEAFEILLVLTKFANIMTQGVVKVYEMCKSVGKLKLTSAAVGGMIHNFHKASKVKANTRPNQSAYLSQGLIATAD
jgi:hypothetical protein